MYTDFPKTTFEKYRRLTPEEALLFWVEYLQEAQNPDRQCSDNNPPSSLKLMALGVGQDEELYTEVNLWDDEPVNIFNRTWVAFELWD